MGKEWERNCDTHKRRTNNADNKIDGLQWSVNIVHKMWTWFVKEWFDRNEKMHGADIVAKERKKRETAIGKARWSCDLKDKAMPRHRDTFCLSTEEHCSNVTTNQLVTWNNMSTPMITSSVQHAR